MKQHLLVLSDQQLAYLRFLLREVHHSRAYYREPLEGCCPLDVGGHCKPVLAQVEQLMIDHNVQPLRVTKMPWPMEGLGVTLAQGEEAA